MSYQTEQIPYVAGMVAGQGVNMLTGQVTTQVFPKVVTTVTPSPSFVQEEVCIQTSDDYANMIQVAAKAEGQAWTEGGQVKVSSSADFLRDQKFSAQALGFVCYRSSTTVSELPSAQALQALQLPADIGDKILTDPQGFLTAYGTHFIAGFVSGGAFVGSIRIEATSQSDMQTIKTTFGTEVNEFAEGKGSIDASFKQHLQEVAQTHSTTINDQGIGVNPPVFDDSTIDKMQDYIDNQFVSDLGTGVPLVAVCYPWEALQCVMTLKGYTAGTLSPPLDQGVLSALRNEYRSLGYAVQTAQDMQTNSNYVSQASASQLQNDLTALYEAQGKIESLTFSDLQKLDQTSVQQYIVSTQLLNDLTQIAAGRALVCWGLQLDGAFTPNTQSDPGSSLSGSSVVFPSSDGTLTSVLEANHGDGTLTCGFVYQVIPVQPGQPTASGLQNQVQLVAGMQWGKDAYRGTPVPGSLSDKTSDTHWEKYSWNHIGVWFGP